MYKCRNIMLTPIQIEDVVLRPFEFIILTKKPEYIEGLHITKIKGDK